MTFVIEATPVAQATIASLRGRARESYERKLRELVAQGCRACGYRLTGESVNRICAVHLADDYRLVAGFPDQRRIRILLVARHSHGDASNVYRTLYELLELPTPSEPRTKPPCCDDAFDPPVDERALETFLRVSGELAERIRRAHHR